MATGASLECDGTRVQLSLRQAELLLEEVRRHESRPNSLDHRHRRPQIGERRVLLAERGVDGGALIQAADAVEIVADAAALCRLLGRGHRVLVPTQTHVGVGQLAQPDSRKRIQLARNHPFEDRRGLLVVAGGGEGRGEPGAELIPDARSASALRQRERLFEIDTGLGIVLQRLVRRRHRVQALQVVEGRARLLVDGQCLQLIVEGRIDAAVRTIQAAQAVVDRAELELPSGFGKERGGRLELRQRLDVCATVEQVVAKRVLCPGLEHLVRCGASIGDHSFVQRCLHRRIEARHAQQLERGHRASPAIAGRFLRGNRPLGELHRLGRLALLFGNHAEHMVGSADAVIESLSLGVHGRRREAFVDRARLRRRCAGRRVLRLPVPRLADPAERLCPGRVEPEPLSTVAHALEEDDGVGAALFEQQLLSGTEPVLDLIGARGHGRGLPRDEIPRDARLEYGHQRDAKRDRHPPTRMHHQVIAHLASLGRADLRERAARLARALAAASAHRLELAAGFGIVASPLLRDGAIPRDARSKRLVGQRGRALERHDRPFGLVEEEPRQSAIEEDLDGLGIPRFERRKIAICLRVVVAPEGIERRLQVGEQRVALAGAAPGQCLQAQRDVRLVERQLETRRGSRVGNRRLRLRTHVWRHFGTWPQQKCGGDHRGRRRAAERQVPP